LTTSCFQSRARPPVPSSVLPAPCCPVVFKAPPDLRLEPQSLGGAGGTEPREKACDSVRGTPEEGTHLRHTCLRNVREVCQAIAGPEVALALDVQFSLGCPKSTSRLSPRFQMSFCISRGARRALPWPRGGNRGGPRTGGSAPCAGAAEASGAMRAQRTELRRRPLPPPATILVRFIIIIRVW
jgi:hypothetical protein